eukprot:425963_1
MVGGFEMMDTLTESENSTPGDGTLSQDGESDSRPPRLPFQGHGIDRENRAKTMFSYSEDNSNRPGESMANNRSAEIRSWGGFKAIKHRISPLANLTITIPDLLRRKRGSFSALDREAMHIDFFLAFLFGETKGRKASEYWVRTLGTMPHWRPGEMRNRVSREFFTILRGFGNMVWCNNPISGIFVIVSMYLDRPFMATCALLGVCGSTWTGRFLGAVPEMVDSGLYSYNGLLCGFYIALTSYKGPGYFQYWLLVNSYLVGSLSSVFMMALSNVLAATYHVSPLSFPYIMAVFMFVGATFSSTYWPPDVYAELPVQPDRDISRLVQYDYWELFLASLRGTSVAQTVMGGIGMTIAAFICSPILAIAGFLGGMVGYASCVYMGVPPDDPFFYSGLYSYNSGLSAQAILMFLVPTKGAFVYSALCCFAVSIAHIGLVNILKPTGLLPGTLAMNIVGICFLLTQLSVTFITPVPLELATIPEDHIIQYHRMKQLVKTLLLSLEKRSRNCSSIYEETSPIPNSQLLTKTKLKVEKLQMASRKIDSTSCTKDDFHANLYNEDNGGVDLIAVRIFMRTVSKDGLLSISQDDIACALDEILPDSQYNHVELHHAIEDLWNFTGKTCKNDVLTEDDVCTVMNIWGGMELQTRELRYLFDTMDVNRVGTLSYADFTAVIKFFPSQVCQESKQVLQNEIYKIFKAEATRRMNEELSGPLDSQHTGSDIINERYESVKDIRLRFGQFVYHLFGDGDRPRGMPPLE